jgi:hypothetical protein
MSRYHFAFETVKLSPPTKGIEVLELESDQINWDTNIFGDDQY